MVYVYSVSRTTTIHLCTLVRGIQLCCAVRLQRSEVQKDLCASVKCLCSVLILQSLLRVSPLFLKMYLGASVTCPFLSAQIYIRLRIKLCHRCVLPFTAVFIFYVRTYVLMLESLPFSMLTLRCCKIHEISFESSESYCMHVEVAV